MNSCIAWYFNLVGTAHILDSILTHIWELFNGALSSLAYFGVGGKGKEQFTLFHSWNIGAINSHYKTSFFINFYILRI